MEKREGVEQIVGDLWSNSYQPNLWRQLEQKAQDFCAEWLEREVVRTDYTQAEQDLSASYLSAFEQAEIKQLAMKILKKTTTDGSGAITRTWSFPHTNDRITIKLRETEFVEGSFQYFYVKIQGVWAHGHGHLPSCSVGRSIIELGSGTGLAGFTCANCGAKTVALSDYLAPLLTNLKFNISLQPQAIQERMCVTKLDWTNPQLPTDYPSNLPHQFSSIIAADVVYDIEHATMLNQVFKKFLLDDPTSECWVMVPSVRTGWKEFEKELDDCGLWNVTKFVFYKSKPKDLDKDHPQNWLLPQFDIPMDHFLYKIIWKNPNKI